MQACKGLVISAQHRATQGSHGLDQGCHWVWLFLSLPASTSFPSLTQALTLYSTICMKTPSQSLLSRAPNLQQSYCSPSAARTLPKGTEDDNPNGCTQCWIQLSLSFPGPGSRTRRRESLPGCSLRFVQWPWHLMHMEGEGAFVVYAGVGDYNV